MKHISAYPTIWQTMPYALYMIDQLENESRKATKDIILKNDDILKKEISEMTLNVRAISVLDKQRNEHTVTDFKQQILNLKGMYTGVFLRSKNGLNLVAGEYTTVRFYLGDNQNSVITKDRHIESIHGFSCLDFEIEDGLKITHNNSNEITLRFDFIPYSFMSNFKSIKDFFKKQQQVFSSKLKGSLES
ncbi:hypothetical protein [Winogradskyella schleiferi]|uniref:hypothetical protein n=1 Tax=Winogradskyella schleiferi TaxID=2686078 RepID=UPI0015BFF508|nr:hypothetical protein [Winogradskyella schleiferi]